MAKILASVNAIWLVTAAIYKFSNLGNNCWCKSNKLSLHQRAYVRLVTPNTPPGVVIWIGGFLMSFLAAGLYLLAINLLRKRPERPYETLGGWEELNTLHARH